MNAKELRLSLNRQWFEMTKSGIKKEEYREITPYWLARLCLCYGKKKTQSTWETYSEICKKDFLHMMSKTMISFVKFEQNTITLGYPKTNDKERIIKFEHKGIEVGYGNPDWGAEPDKLYFIIKHGEIK